MKFVQIITRSVNLVHLVLLQERVFLCEFGLLLREVVERAAVALGVAVLAAVDVAALAGQLQDAYFLLAIPAFV